jgi:Icc-related predicted phosphoesterase
MPKEEKLKIAAMGDLHAQEAAKNYFKDFFSKIHEKADVVVLCGDLTQLGLPNEAEILAEDLSLCRIPVVAVLGNHDYESGHQDEVVQILKQAKAHMLEETPFEFNGVGFAGVKGFGGGFEPHMLGPFGEAGTKAFVDEVLKESLQLEKQLSILNTEKKVVAMHYSPIKETVVGEPEEIWPFLGSTRLMEPIDNFNASVVFHGHAHFGTASGKTNKGIPVFNCSRFVMEKIDPEQNFAIYEL